MRPIPRLVVALALAVLAVGPAAWAADTSLHLVLTPSQKPTDLLAAGEEFGRALGRLVGASVRVTVASDYAAVVEALRNRTADLAFVHPRSEEHTSELQSQSNLVCRLLLGTKKK